MARRVTTVIFDLGETLLDETRAWEAIADALGVPRFTFFAVFGAMIERRESHRRVFDLLGGPAPDVSRELYRRENLYPDAEPCLSAVAAAGYRIGIAANQPSFANAFIRSLRDDLCLAGCSESWGVNKPSPQFFARIAEEVGAGPDEIVYVGDRVDNDVLPAIEAGMVGIHIRRGPWGYLHADWPEAARAHARIDSLAELPEVLARV
jgi:HAD superfamily hydrolase (TIGR01549 family)